jgi:hypothetical protein
MEKKITDFPHESWKRKQQISPLSLMENGQEIVTMS